jgi:Mn-containing catalase
VDVYAESTGRVLATRLYELTDDSGMKDMLSFLIARDTMHQNQWMAVLEDLGGIAATHPIPNSFPQKEENSNVNYSFISTNINGDSQAQGRWSSGTSIDGKGTFTFEQARPFGDVPVLGVPDKETHAQTEQMNGEAKSFLSKVADVISGS